MGPLDKKQWAALSVDDENYSAELFCAGLEQEGTIYSSLLLVFPTLCLLPPFLLWLGIQYISQLGTQFAKMLDVFQCRFVDTTATNLNLLDEDENYPSIYQNYRIETGRVTTSEIFNLPSMRVG